MKLNKFIFSEFLCLLMPPKTIKGSIRKALTGDGRKNLNTAIRESVSPKITKKKKS